MDLLFEGFRAAWIRPQSYRSCRNTRAEWECGYVSELMRIVAGGESQNARDGAMVSGIERFL